ncbi:hypothetical protein DL768_010191 [Monosporascus sp. mg162]|nr:hypothetical protein DL768_010191 [Monosporascus sp. mg162]
MGKRKGLAPSAAAGFYSTLRGPALPNASINPPGPIGYPSVGWLTPRRPSATQARRGILERRSHLSRLIRPPIPGLPESITRARAERDMRDDIFGDFLGFSWSFPQLGGGADGPASAVVSQQQQPRRQAAAEKPAAAAAAPARVDERAAHRKRDRRDSARDAELRREIVKLSLDY